jgi:hypothetical protein
MNLLVHIPIVTEADVGDFGDMVKQNKKYLAYSMAYVAARFVPGCRSIRAMLTPELLHMLKIRFDPFEREDTEHWMLLQAFAVLYTWATPQNIEVHLDGDGRETELRQDVLRSSLEMLALRYSVHRAGEEVIRLLRHDTGDVRQTFIFRKYCYWLWMFSTAHFQSLVLRTPPSVREDATIRWANEHLEQYTNDEHIQRILAHVSLGLLWTQGCLKDRVVGEWWCSIPGETDLTSALARLTAVDADLNHWHRRWFRHEQHQPSSNFASDPAGSSLIDFYQRFTRLCISIHVNELLQSSASAETLPLSIVNPVTQSVERASTFGQVFLELTPLVKSSIRFAPESIFAMVAFACEWVIRARSFFPGLDCVKRNDLTTIRGVAELMVDLGVDNKHSARIYGESILVKLNAASKQQQQPRSPSWKGPHPDQPWPTPNSNMGSRTLIDSVTAMDGVWPMRNPAIQRPQSTGPPLGLAITSDNGGEIFANYNHGPEYFNYDPSWSI